MPAPASSSIDLLLSSFERYLVSERGLAAGTIVGYVSHARWFLDGLGSGGVAGLSAAEVTGAVLRKAASGVSVSAAQNFVSGLRAFLRFCFLEGLRRGGSVAGGAGGAGSAGVVAAARDQLGRMLGRCWIPAIAAGRSGGATTR